MDKSKVILISVVVFAISIVLSSFIIAVGLKDLGEIISYGLQSGSEKISSGLYNYASVQNRGSEDNKDILNLQEAAEYMKIQSSELLQLTMNLELPSIKIGNKYIFSRKAIDKWMEYKTLVVN